MTALNLTRPMTVLRLALTALLVAGCATVSVQPLQGQTTDQAGQARDACLD